MSGEQGDGEGSEEGTPGAGPPSFISIRIEARVRPTEDAEGILRAIEALFPDMEEGWEDGGAGAASPEREGWTRIIGTASDPEEFRQAVRSRAIADAVAVHMVGEGRPAAGGWEIPILVNRQAAMAGKFHLGDDSGALDDIAVTFMLEEEPTRRGLVAWFLSAGTPGVEGRE